MSGVGGAGLGVTFPDTQRRGRRAPLPFHTNIRERDIKVNQKPVKGHSLDNGMLWLRCYWQRHLA